MPLIPLQRNLSSGCDVGKALRDMNYLVRCIDEAIDEGKYRELVTLIKTLAIYSEHGDKVKLLTALGYAFSKAPSKTLRAAIEVLSGSNVVLSKLIETLSAIVGMNRLIVLSTKYKLLNDRLVNNIVDKLSCNELATLTECIVNSALSKETVIKVLTRALTTAYCRESKKSAIKLITDLLVDGRLSKDELIQILRKLNMKLIIIKNKQGEVKEIKLVSKFEDYVPANEDYVLSFINYVL